LIEKFNPYKFGSPDFKGHDDYESLRAVEALYTSQDGDSFIDPFTGRKYPGLGNFPSLKASYFKSPKITFTDELTGKEFFTREGEEYFCRTRGILAEYLTKKSFKEVKLKAKASGKKYYLPTSYYPLPEDEPLTSEYPVVPIKRTYSLGSVERKKYALEFPRGQVLYVSEGSHLGATVISTGEYRTFGHSRQYLVKDSDGRSFWKYVSHLRPFSWDVYEE
jgi:hypothetical protein